MLHIRQICISKHLTCDETYTCFVTTSLRAFLAANLITPWPTFCSFCLTNTQHTTSVARIPTSTDAQQFTSHWLAHCLQCADTVNWASWRASTQTHSTARVGFLPWQKLFLPRQWKKPVKTVAKTGKNWQNQRQHILITDFITHILQAAFEPYYNSGTDSEHK